MTASLAEIERSTARRLGPFYQLPVDRQVPATSHFEYALVPSLRSTVEQDLVTNLWLLRRGEVVSPINWRGAWDELGVYVAYDGVDYGGSQYFTREPTIVGIPGILPPDSDTHWILYTGPYTTGNTVEVPPEDRQRMVANYDPERGQVTVDRPWSVIPAPGEVLEFHHLNPELELREAVRAGLRRCLFEDRFNLGQGYIYEADLTSALPWLDDLNMVKRVQFTPFPSGFGGGPSDVPFTVFGECGNVWIRVTGYDGVYYGGLLVTVHRPHFSWVNGTDAASGPLRDDDVLNVDLDYAAAAGHIEAWHNFPARLQAAAAGGAQATQQMAALEFTRQSHAHRLPRHDLHSLHSRFGWNAARTVVINA